jgi:release factor glutamine methyltransferase
MPKTVAEVLSSGSGYLSGKGIEAPDRVCCLLLGRLLGCRPLDVLLKSEHVLDDRRLDAMRRGVRRVASGEPVQYVIGQWEFMGHTLKVDSRALVPRPETEGLVQRVLDCGSVWDRDRPLVADVGTGTGCIAISLALARPRSLIIALDTSREALMLAHENAVALGVQQRVGFTDREICDALDPQSVDALVANLPYVPTADYEKLPGSIRDHEPRAALDGGADGLDAIRAVVPDAAMAIAPRGRIFLEIGERQTDAVREILFESGFGPVAIEKDLSGRDRYAIGTLGDL